MSIYATLAFFVLLTLILLGATLLFKFIWVGRSRRRRFLMRFVLSLSTLLYLFLLLEALFSTCFIVSDGRNFTLSSRRWFERYWHPINSYGYRDVEHPLSSFEGKKVIFVVGDSFVAGHGIKNFADRFSNVLGKRLGPEYVVVNIAKNGWNTSDEYRALVSYPYQPDTIILSYFLNDVVGAAARSGSPPPQIEPPPAGLRYVVGHSYFLNFVYWRLYMEGNRDLGPRTWEHTQRSYADPEIWKTHAEELQAIIDHARGRNINLIVVVFPNLRFVKGSEQITAKVASFFNQNDVPVLDLAPMLEDRDPQTLIVSPLDAHPNESVHAFVADRLFEEVKKVER